MQPFMRDDENQNNENQNNQNQNQEDQLKSFDLNLEGIQSVSGQQEQSDFDPDSGEPENSAEEISQSQEDQHTPLPQENEQQQQSINFGSLQSQDPQEQSQEPVSFQMQSDDDQQEDSQQNSPVVDETCEDDEYKNAQPCVQEIKISGSDDYSRQAQEQQQHQPDEQTQSQDQLEQEPGPSQPVEQNTNSSFNPEPVTKTQSQSFAIPDEEQVAEQDSEFLEPASSEKNLKQSTIILMVLFLLGGACVWFMIKKTSPSAANAAVTPEETRLEQAIASINNSQQTKNKMQDILDKFYKFAEFEQISVSQLKKNPFAKNTDIQSVDSLVDSDMDAERGTTYIRNMKLWSVIEGDGQKSCMIGDKILTQGDRILNYQVSKINQKSVELVSSDGATIVLKINE